MKKKLIIIAGVGLVLVFVGLLVLDIFIDKAIKTGVETFGPPIMGTSVQLEGVTISMLSGSGSVRGLVIGNPAGYKQPSVIQLGLASLSLSPSSVLSDKIVIKSIAVEAPQITFEGGLKGNNLSKLLANIEAATGSSKPAANNKPSSTQSSSKKIQIGDFRLSNAKVNVTLTDLGGKTLSLTLPEIHLTDLGTGTDGLTPADLSKQLVTVILAKTTEAVAGQLKNIDVGKLGTDLGKELNKNATESATKATKGISDLFKKK